MANIYAKSLTFPGLNNTYLFEQILNGCGDIMASDANIDDIKTPGKYYSGSVSHTSGLSGDIPTSTGFTLIVLNGYIDGRVYQYIFPNENTVFRRYFGGSTWSSWTSDGKALMVGADSYGDTLPSYGSEGRVFFKLT